jgi:site-specific DNA-cytosine methylase
VGSEMLGEVKATLISCGYTFRQLLLSPIQSAALPNHRMRFYLIAQHRDTQAGDQDWDPDLILEQFPPRIRWAAYFLSGRCEHVRDCTRLAKHTSEPAS